MSADNRYEGGTSVWQYLLRKTDTTATGEPWVVVYTNEPPTAITAQMLDSNTTDRAAFYRIRAERKQ